MDLYFSTRCFNGLCVTSFFFLRLFKMHKSNILLILLTSSMFRNRLNRIGRKNFIQWLSCDAANRNCMRTTLYTLIRRVFVLEATTTTTTVCKYADEWTANDPANIRNSGGVLYDVVQHISQWCERTSRKRTCSVCAAQHTARPEQSR